MSSYDEHLISQAGGDGESHGRNEMLRTISGTRHMWALQLQVPDDIVKHVAAGITDALVSAGYSRDQAKKLDAVRKLHEPVMEDGEPVGCSMCDWEHPSYSFNKPWPCPTLAALESKP